MSSVDFHSEHGTAHLHGSEGHYLMHLPYAVTLGFLNPTGFKAHERFADIIAPDSHLRGANGIGFGMMFTNAWSVGGEGNFAWRGQPLDQFQISLNTALAVGGDPLKFACRFAFYGYPWVDGPNRGWLADIIDEGQRMSLFRGPHQGWAGVAELLRSRDDGPVVIGNSTGDAGWPTPHLGGWFPPELGNDCRLLTKEQQREWDERADAWFEIEPAEQWRISMTALRGHEKGLEMRPDTWNDLYFGKRITVFDLLAGDRDERLARVFGLQPASAPR